MIKIEETNTVGFPEAVRGMRNPFESWAKSDSCWVSDAQYNVGKNDRDLMRRLVLAGTDHSKFMRFIIVYADITAPLYWWKEFDTYRAGVEKNSCSTMHTLDRCDLTIDDFSVERTCDRYIPQIQETIAALNDARRQYKETGDSDFWESMIQLLPSSYNQKRTVMVSYQALRNMYHARNHHKLKEWHKFREWCEKLPLAFLITMEGNK